MSRGGYREATTPQSKGKRIHHLEIHNGEDGGHRVVHHFHDDGMAYYPPKEHMFGKDEGHEVMAHVAKHAGIEHGEEASEEEE